MDSANTPAAQAFAAAAAGDVEPLAEILDRDSHLLHAIQTYKGILLHEAGSAAVARLLLDRGLDPNAPGWMGAQPLHKAASRGDVETVRLLLERGADVNGKRERGDTPLHWAKTAEVAEALLAAGADREVRDFSGRTQLHWAAQASLPEVIDVLVRHGAVVDAPSNGNVTPLHTAVQSRNPESVRILLGAGANVNAPSENGTPLHFAAFYNDTPLCALLLEHGADIAARNPAGQTPLQVASEGNRAGIILNSGRSEEGNVRAFLRERMEAILGTADAPLPGPLVSERLRLHPTRAEAVTLIQSGRLVRWSLRGKKARLLSTVATGFSSVRDIALSPVDGTIALVVPDEAIELRRFEDLSLIAQIPLPGAGGVYSVTWSPNGRYIAAGVQEEVFLIDANTQTIIGRSGVGVANIAITYSPDGGILPLGCIDQGDSSLQLHPVENGLPHQDEDEDEDSTEPVWTKIGKGNAYIDTIRFRPDGRYVLVYHSSEFNEEEAEEQDAPTDGWRGVVTLCDAVTGQVVWSFTVDASVTGDTRSLGQEGYEHRFLTEPVFLTEREIACGSTHGTLFCLDVETGTLTRRLPTPPDSAIADVLSLAVTPGGKHLWAALSDGSIQRIT